ncbi:hypothetical protein ATO7_16469 [Oceanococcus atlanticus]|uniref:CD-NTase-associated protein 12/Pycsar effector protein TIR domain-containing protein n=1 Tax=Oceanococcus atlanticus TaxID=1317117 RepID=A0A1Y1S9V5_9GAMM|nr:TIR domain-containing protein [Oceanococcus atlanticus]ORE84899.1 hypothetical protein ATO7_16469 [Oceanococcus atlanticus]
MTESARKLSIFYSWQSDLPDASNRGFIRQQLRKVANTVESQNDGIVVAIDEATRDVSGSPNIPQTILAKIQEADVFVCDITTINSSVTSGRKVPNPNVVFELGFAAALLGWQRIILLFNESVGKFPEDLPFDFDRHRASTYKTSDQPTPKQAKRLEKLLQVAIQAVLDDNPERPSGDVSPEARRRKRDIENIRWVLSSLHLPTIDQHLLECPHMLSDRTLYFWEGFNGVVTNSLFHLYDSSLADEFDKFHDAFHETIRHGEMYHPTRSGEAYVFGNPSAGPRTKRQDRAWEKMASATKSMRISLDRILSVIRNDYIEVDVDSTNRSAWKEYVDFKRDVARGLESDDA